MTAGSSGNVHFGRSDTALTSRAREALRHGPLDVVALISHVCQLPRPSHGVAAHLARVLLAGDAQFVEGPLGTWSLREASQVDAAPNDEGLRDLEFVVVDVETTGARATMGDRVTEVAAVKVRNGDVGEVYQSLVNPERPIPPFITALTRITDDMVRGAPLFAEITPTLSSVLAGGVFTAHNAAFDWRFVSAEVSRATGEEMRGRRLCTVRLARILLPQLSRRSLDAVSRYFGVENTDRHRAAGDALATARCLIRMLDLAQDQGIETWQALEQCLERKRSSRRRRRASPTWQQRDTTA